MQALKMDGAAYFATADEALAWAKSSLKPGDALLVKGSNSIGLGRIVSALRGAA
jgi:UDP-N-acetylmuramoyl-tripeptide--D-alanyl-D-alanine ligase